MVVHLFDSVIRDMSVSLSVHVPPEIVKAEVTVILSLLYHILIKIFIFLTVQPQKLLTLVAPLLIVKILITKALIPLFVMQLLDGWLLG